MSSLRSWVSWPRKDMENQIGAQPANTVPSDDIPRSNPAVELPSSNASAEVDADKENAAEKRSFFSVPAISVPNVLNSIRPSLFGGSEMTSEEDIVTVTKSEKLSIDVSDKGVIVEHKSAVSKLKSSQKRLNRDSSAIQMPLGKMRVKIIQLDLHKPVKNPYVRIRIGDQIFNTSVADGSTGNWQESFDFFINYHLQMFGMIQLDVYSANVFVPDEHLGRAELRLSYLEKMPDQFTSWLELFNRLQTTTLTPVSDLTKDVINTGAIQIKTYYKYQQIENVVENRDHLVMEPPEDAGDPQEQIYVQTDEKLVETDIKEDIVDVNNRSGKLSSWRSWFGFGKPSEVEIEDPFKSSSLSTPPPQSTDSSQSAQNQVTFNDSPPSSSLDIFSLDSVLSSFVMSAATRQTLKSLLQIVAAFSQGIDSVSNMEWIVGIMLLEKYYRNVEVPRTHHIVFDRAFIRESLHYVKYTTVAYGSLVLNILGRGNGIVKDSLRRATTKATLLEYLTHLTEDDILAHEVSAGGVFKPHYFIVWEKDTQHLVVSIRGTMNAADTLTDLICDYQKWGNDGLVHRGMKSSADWFIQNVWPDVKEHILEKKAKKLVVVGHSMGAGTAALFTILLHQLYLPQLRLVLSDPDFSIHCFAFAPPPILSLNVASQYEELIDSFVLDSDVVCRLSYGSVLDLRSLAIAAFSGVDSCFDELTSLFRRKSVDDQDPSLQARIKLIDKCREHVIQANVNPKLVIPGKIYHIRQILPASQSDPQLFANSSGNFSSSNEVPSSTEPKPTSSSFSSYLPSFSLPFGRKVQPDTSIPSNNNQEDIEQLNHRVNEFKPFLSSLKDQKQSDSTRVSASSSEILNLTATDITKRYIIESSKPDNLTEIILKRSMFLDHFPTSYENALVEWLGDDEEDETDEEVLALK
ncbi:hypothetical protein BKA69DRAFT_1124415 [Paraphysoderma sedebokerense]|nr:hypothetical protein BKA69DRAFT_1124415 [Paraphysoderma sedebokerense]